MTNEERKQALLMQFEISKACAEHYMSRIKTQAYLDKIGTMYNVRPNNQRIPMTGEVILRHEIRIHLNHIHNMNTAIEDYKSLCNE